MRNYTKAELEALVWVQLANLDGLNEQIRLLREQNEYLLDFNNKLIEELSESKKKSKPYPTPKEILKQEKEKKKREEEGVYLVA